MQLDAAIKALAGWGEPGFRAVQVRQAIARDLVSSWDEVTTLPIALRARLEEAVPFSELTLQTELRSTDGTVKARFVTADGFPVETVLMRHGDRLAVCLSSQSGCALACTFCATGTMGLGRNLSSGMLFEQLLWAAREARAVGGRVANVVMMGMGEPFMNYDAVLTFCRTANDPEGFGLGARSIAISTAGWVPGIARLAGEPMQLRLALSLHAANDDLRRSLMPVTRRFPLADVMSACADYRAATRRRVFIEYLLLDGVNDEPEHAAELVRLLRHWLPGGHHVNLIVYNPTAADYRASDDRRVGRFMGVLERWATPHTLRHSRGRDIDAACGQLAARGVRERRAELRAGGRGVPRQ